MRAGAAGTDAGSSTLITTIRVLGAVGTGGRFGALPVTPPLTPPLTPLPANNAQLRLADVGHETDAVRLLVAVAEDVQDVYVDAEEAIGGRHRTTERTRPGDHRPQPITQVIAALRILDRSMLRP